MVSLVQSKACPEPIKKKYLTAFDVSFEYVLSAAARRQKWIDQSQSVNLFPWYS